MALDRPRSVWKQKQQPQVGPPSNVVASVRGDHTQSRLQSNATHRRITRLSINTARAYITAMTVTFEQTARDSSDGTVGRIAELPEL